MTTDLEQRLEKAVDELERASDEELASEVEEYREGLEDCEFDGSALGGVALETATSSTEPPMTISEEQISNLVEHVEIGELRRFLAGIQQVAQTVRVSIRVGLREILENLEQDVQRETADQPNEPVELDKRCVRVSSEDSNTGDRNSSDFDDMVA